jgi:hypothetical protein
MLVNFNQGAWPISAIERPTVAAKARQSRSENTIKMFLALLPGTRSLDEKRLSSLKEESLVNA